MEKLHLKRILLFIVVLVGFIGKMNGQITPSSAGYLDAVADYGADPTGGSVTTSSLQNAINGAISQGKALFIPEGTYLIDGSLRVNCDSYEAHEKPVIIAGSSVNASKRTTLLLKSGTFTDPANPGTMMMSEAWTGANADTYDRVIQSVDFKIEDNNSGAIALNWRGAEGCGIFDVNIDVTGGFRGMLQAPGSGGSTVDVTVIGGVIGIDLSGTDLSGGGTQPTPVFTHITLIGQTGAAFKTNWNRGSVVITGAHIVLTPGVNAFHGMKPNMFQYYPGGNLLLTDSKIEYTSYDASNLAFYFWDAAADNGVNFDNVYVKNADRIIDHDFTVNSNKDGWTHFRKLAYSSGSETFSQGVVQQNVYLEGVNQGGVYEDSEIATEIPSNLVSYHGWGETFPSFETPGVINVADYSDLVVNGDWAPAFNQAIADASGGSETVFVPSGDYEIYSTIELGLHTRLIGVSSFTSRILGYDMDGQRFGGSEDPYGDSRPMIQTQENISADNILADIAVRPVGAFNLASHNPTPTPHYALLWRAGRHSIIRNILTDHYKGSAYFRPSNCFNTLRKSSWLSLHSIASPTTIEELTFSSDSKSQFFNYTELPSRIWLETVNGSQRLMARSHSPNNVANTTIKRPNIILEKGGNTFAINSLEVSNAAWNSKAGHDVVIEGYSGDSKVQEAVVLMTGLNKPRENHEAVTLDWTGITKVIIKSESMFSIDNVTVDGALIDFESVIGTEPAADVDYASALYYDTARDLPLSMIYNHLSIITGGVKWYNHWKHGDTWMAPEKAYVAVLNNTEPVNFYHFHAQHSQNDQKVYLENARDVSIFGIKTENTTYFLKAFNSNNIRVFGHGGLTNPAPPSSHYYFDNTSNYMVASVSDELNTDDNCMYCGSGNALLIKAAFGSYDVIKDVTDQTIITPERTDRPILWQKGSPYAVYLENCTATQSLTVVNGSGSGDICVGSAVNVIAEKPDCKTFVQWTGDVQYLNDSTSSTTSFLMPDQAVTIEAVYEDKPMHTVTIEGGIGSGSYCANQLVEITAEPVAGDVFVSWTGSTGELSDVTLANQSFSMPESDLNISATFKTNLAYNKSATALTERVDKGRYASLATDGDNTTRWESEFSDPQWITVDLGAVTTFNEVGINWEAAYATAYQVQVSTDNQTWTDIFTTTTGDGGYDLITTDNSARYIRVYCTQRATIYGYSIYEIEVFGDENPSELVSLEVIDGIGSGVYPKDSVVDISANTAPEGMIFDHWSGDTLSVVDPFNSSTEVIMPASNVVLSAQYKSIEIFYDLTINVSGEGSVNPIAGSHVYAEGTVVDINATPAIGWQTASAPESVLMDSDQTVNVVFEKKPVVDAYRYLRVHVVRGENTYMIDEIDWNDGNINYPNPHLSELYFDGDYTTGQYFHVGVEADVVLDLGEGNEIVPSFVELEQPSWAQAMCDSICFEASNDSLNWTRLGLIVSPSKEDFLNDKLTVNFETNPRYNLSIESGTGDGFYLSGEEILITADEAPVGKEFAQWTGDVSWVEDIYNPVTKVYMPSSDVDLSADYKNTVNYYNLTITKSGEGTVEPVVGTHTFEEGAVVDIVATPAMGWQIVSAPDSIVMNSDQTVDVVFEEISSLNAYRYLRFTVLTKNTSYAMKLNGIEWISDQGRYVASGPTGNVDVMPWEVILDLGVGNEIVPTGIDILTISNTNKTAGHCIADGSNDLQSWDVFLDTTLVSSDFISDSNNAFYFNVDQLKSGYLFHSEYKNEGIDLLVYPNPTDGILTVRSNEEIFRLELYNLAGELLYSRDNLNQLKALIDLKFLEDGIYLLKINGDVLEKIVVKK